MAFFKVKAIRDRGYLDWLRGQPCAVTNHRAESDPAHVRFGADGGLGMKPSDNHALPLAHHLHARQHQIGEVSFWRERLLQDEHLMMRCVRALAHEYYAEYLEQKR